MKILFIIIVLAIAFVLFLNLYEHYTENSVTCVWCYERIPRGEQIEIQYEPKRWVCRDCWAKLDYLFYSQYGCEVSGERMERINRIVDRR